jgi:hypothetical protein
LADFLRLTGGLRLAEDDAGDFESEFQDSHQEIDRTFRKL